MPTYEYRCKDCGEDLEVVQSFSDEPLDTCPRCGGSLKKLFGSVGISFKGFGVLQDRQPGHHQDGDEDRRRCQHFVGVVHHVLRLIGLVGFFGLVELLDPNDHHPLGTGGAEQEGSDAGLIVATGQAVHR